MGYDSGEKIPEVPVRKVGFVILLIALFFSVYAQTDSRSITVLDVERVGDRLLKTTELSRLLEQAQAMPMAVDIGQGGQLYGVEARGNRYVIRNLAGRMSYISESPIRLLAGLGDEFLIGRQTDSGWQLISYQPQTNQETPVGEFHGCDIGDVALWQNDVYLEVVSPAEDIIYRYQAADKKLSVFVSNGFEPKVYHNRLYYIYRKGESSGIESISADGTQRNSFAPQYSAIYSFFLRHGGIDLLGHTQHAGRHHFLRIQDAFGAAEIEKFELFEARFQSPGLVFGSNGKRDSLLLDNTLIQMPTELHFRGLIDDWVYFVYQSDHYRLPITSLEAILTDQE